MRTKRLPESPKRHSLTYSTTKNLFLACVLIIGLLGGGLGTACADVPQAPVLSYTTKGVVLTKSWTSIPGVTGYNLY